MCQALRVARRGAHRGAHDNRSPSPPSPRSPGRPRQRRPGAVAEAVPHAVVAVLPRIDLHPAAVAAPAARQTLVGAGGRGLSSANGEIHSGSIAAMAPGRYACQGRRASEQAAAQTVLACPLPSQGDERLVAAAAVELPPLQAARLVAGDETAGCGGNRLIGCGSWVGSGWVVGCTGRKQVARCTPTARQAPCIEHRGPQDAVPAAQAATAVRATGDLFAGCATAAWKGHLTGIHQAVEESHCPMPVSVKGACGKEGTEGWACCGAERSRSSSHRVRWGMKEPWGVRWKAGHAQDQVLLATRVLPTAGSCRCHARRSPLPGAPAAARRAAGCPLRQ